jgi:Flp pilus assembly protein TadG
MNVKRFCLTLIIAALATAQVQIVSAQSEQLTRRADVGWATIARSSETRPAAQKFEPAQDVQAATIGAQDVDPKKKIVGSWVLTVSPVGGAAFDSLQTYNEDGTMTETSSQLGQLTIGPAHGVWEGRKSDYNVTFELFFFTPSGESAGRLRVRAKIRLTNDDTLTADGVVDIIQPDGTVIPNVGITPFTGTRLKVVPAN